MMGASYDTAAALCKQLGIAHNPLYDRQTFTLPVLPNGSGALGVAFYGLNVRGVSFSELSGRCSEAKITVVTKEILKEARAALPEPRFADAYIGSSTICGCTETIPDIQCALNRFPSCRCSADGIWETPVYPHELVAGIYRFDIEGKSFLGGGASLWELRQMGSGLRYVSELSKDWGMWKAISSPGTMIFDLQRRRICLRLNREIYDLPLLYRRLLYLSGAVRYPKDGSWDDKLGRFTVVYRNLSPNASRSIARKLGLSYEVI